uniref:Conserved oligomeric Golgi complex subunit 2 n=1 Tax=Mycena chlorophos TaxID=658473 RepID=A0ABQ0LYD5_MYCCL|nr:conserved oligomeric Golgi complex subunit 2-like [Mycena chlorophos]
MSNFDQLLEVASRESGKEGTHALPDLPPLDHDNPFLTSSTFDVEGFLLSRAQLTLAEERAELREYLAKLKEELVQLINNDYEAFISLSTDLRDEGARLERIKLPLDGLKAEILESKRELHVIQDTIQDKLQKRAALREEKALLHLLLKISESVTRLESLLLIASPPEDAGQDIDTRPVILEDAVDDRSRSNKAKHLGRVASEYTQLLYHTSKARAEQCVFVDEIQWRIDRIRSTLSSDLDHLFSTTLIALTDTKSDVRTPEEKKQSISDLTECLRTYDAMGLWRDAEDVLRRDVVRRFVKKSIFPGALTAPPSPIVPHTPFRAMTTAAPGSALPPRTPYTPFSSRTPLRFNYSASTSPYAHLLEDPEDPLARLYNQILRFVERDMTTIMGLAEKIAVKPKPVRKDRSLVISLAKPDPPDTDEDGFQIMANVVWEELGRSIMDELGLVVFAAGRPNEFRKHYEITQAFIRSLEFLAPSAQAVEAMRAHHVYVAFERRWQLPVYFQMRWKEIVGKMEEALANPRVELIKAESQEAFDSVQAAAVWVAITACWSAEVFIPELSHRFWRLTLQFLSRYKTWLVNSLIPDDQQSIIAPTDRQTAESAAADDAILKQYASIIVDARAMSVNVEALWREEISLMLPEASAEERVANEETLLQSLASMTAATAPMTSHIISIITKRCCDELARVKSLSSTLRAMSNKSMPKNPSHWVSSILRPIKVFFAIGVAQGPGSALKEHFVESYAADIFEGVCQKYIFELTQLKKMEERLRRLNKGKKATSFLFGGGAKEDDGRRDEERIRQQMIIDVEAFGKDAQLLGVALDKSQCYAKLAEMVHEVDAPEISLWYVTCTPYLRLRHATMSFLRSATRRGPTTTHRAASRVAQLVLARRISSSVTPRDTIPVFSTAPVTLRPVADDLAVYGASRTLAGILSNDETFENIIEVHQLRPSQSHALSVPAQFFIPSMLHACADLSREIIGDHPDVDESLRVLHSLGKDKAQIRGSKEAYSWDIVDPNAKKYTNPSVDYTIEVIPTIQVADGLNKGLDLSPEIMRPMHDSLSPRAVYITHPSKKEPNPQVQVLMGGITELLKSGRTSLISVLTTGTSWQFYYIRQTGATISHRATSPLNLGGDTLAILKLLVASTVGDPEDFVKFAAVS